MTRSTHSQYTAIETFCHDNSCLYEKNCTLAPLTSIKIGGPCDILVKPENESVLSGAIQICRSENIPYFILGKGSNILVSGSGYRGCVILLSNNFEGVDASGNMLTARAGASLRSVCIKALDCALSGLEFAYGIPGSAGGALYMNAGAYGGEIKDAVVSCKYIDERGMIREMAKEEMELSYRSSVFSRKNLCITSVTFALTPGEKSSIKGRMDELMRRRREKQPLEYPSCGSTFKRPEGYYAAALIEECGLKGLTIGGAQVSEKHSGFIINRGGAAYEDVVALVNEVKHIVFEKKGVKLECEMLILNDK